MRSKPSTPARRTAVVELTIGELAQGGRGVGVCDVEGSFATRRAVFVPDVALGELVRVEADFSKRPAEGTLLAVLAPSPDRVTPACSYVSTCGGCDWMHLSEDARRNAHARMVASVLPPAFRHVAVEAHHAQAVLAYRTRTRLHLEVRPGHLRIGMHGRRSHEPISVDTCIVLDPRLDEARRILAQCLQGAEGEGEARLSSSQPGSSRTAVIDLHFTGALPGEVFGRFERAVAERKLAGVRIFHGDVRLPARIGDPTPWIEGADGRPLELAPGGFSQATETGNIDLSRRVAEHAQALVPEGSPTVELYAGAGNLTVLLARFLRVTAVESDKAACTAARSNLAARGLSGKVVCADAATHRIDKADRLVVLDPPRAGAREVVAAIAAKPRAAVIYVSCNPPTLGRDLTVLADAGFALRSVETFEMFPQTSHVETIAVLTPPKESR